MGPNWAEQNLPPTTESAVSYVQAIDERFDASKDDLQPPVAGNSLASKKGVGQAPWPTTDEFDISSCVCECEISEVEIRSLWVSKKYTAPIEVQCRRWRKNQRVVFVRSYLVRFVSKSGNSETLYLSKDVSTLCGA